MSKAFRYQITGPGKPHEKVEVDTTLPGPDEIAIRTKAVALNPLDWKMAFYGAMVKTWPIVLGFDAAGTIEAVGEHITDFKAGDEVFSMAGWGARAGGLQQIYVVPPRLVARRPLSVTTEEAASLPLCFLTAASAIVLGLHTSLPFLQSPTQRELKTILVTGGSSAVGSAAIQLLRLALPCAVIFTTSSAKHHERLRGLGANWCYERDAEELELSINAETVGKMGVDAILDPVAAANQRPQLFNVLRPDGPRLYAQVMTGENVEVPEGVESTPIIAQNLFGVTGASRCFAALAEMLENGQYILPVPVEVVGTFDDWDAGLKRLQQGVSGLKLVVTAPDVHAQL